MNVNGGAVTEERKREKEKEPISAATNEGVRGCWNGRGERECRTSGGKTKEWESSRHISHRANNRRSLNDRRFVREYIYMYSKNLHEAYPDRDVKSVIRLENIVIF